MEIRQKRTLDKKWIDKHAYKIVRTLQEEGFNSYLVGGCVRDLLVGLPPKDFDIATDASPRDVKKKIKNSYIIGKRFRLVLVYRHKVQYEVATFRRDPTKEELESDDIESKDNVFGNPVEDARRRDFTVNALFYDCVEDELIDYVDGLKDIDARVIRMIGEPDERLTEDPVRILRAVRLSHKLAFELEPSLRESIVRNAPALKQAAVPRIREDFLKIFRLQDPFRALTELYDLGVMQVCFPSLVEIWQDVFRLEAFRWYLEHKEQILTDNPDPCEELAFLSYIYLKVVSEKKKFSSIMKDFKESKHTRFFKDELFIFNAEAAWTKKLFATIERLASTNIDNLKGKSRQHYAKQKHTSIALRYAKLEHSIPAEEIQKWECNIEKFR